MSARLSVWLSVRPSVRLSVLVAGLLSDSWLSSPSPPTSIHVNMFTRAGLGWAENDRGVSYTFGADIVTKVLTLNDLDMVCRAHQVREHVVHDDHTSSCDSLVIPYQSVKVSQSVLVE